MSGFILDRCNTPEHEHCFQVHDYDHRVEIILHGYSVYEYPIVPGYEHVSYLKVLSVLIGSMGFLQRERVMNVVCPECRKPISDKFNQTCPHCGYFIPIPLDLNLISTIHRENTASALFIPLLCVSIALTVVLLAEYIRLIR